MKRTGIHPTLKMHYGRLALCLILAVVALHADTSSALACSVGPGWYPATIAERVHAAEYVLEATADVFEQSGYHNNATAAFTVHHWFKGNGPTRVTVSGFGGGGDCQTPIPGGRAILFVTGDPAGVMQLYYVGPYDAVEPAYPPIELEVIEAVKSEANLPQPASTPDPVPLVNVTRPQSCPLQSLRCLRPAALVIPVAVTLLVALGVGLLIGKRRSSMAKVWQKIRNHLRAVGCSISIAVATLAIGLGLYHFVQQHQLPLSCLPNCAYVDLRQADLSRIDLSSGDFSHARLDNAYLSQTNLSRADLTASDLSGAKLYSANLSQAILRNADLQQANLTSADLRGADMRGANLDQVWWRDAKIDETTQVDDQRRLAWKISNETLKDRSLQHIDLRGINWYGRELANIDLTGANLSASNLQGTRWMTATLDRADLRGAILTAAFLRNFSLREANLEGADLRYASFICYEYEEACDLRGANLRQANLDFLRVDDLDPVDLRGADLRGASLNGVDLRGLIIDETTQLDEKWQRVWEIVNQPQIQRKLPGADLRWALLQETNLQEADLPAANLFRADLTLANLSGANLRGANLQGAVLTNANLIGADLRDADLRWADLNNAALLNVMVNDQTQLDPRWLLAWEIVREPQAGRDLTGVDLSWTSLSNANLTNAKLSKADLSYTRIYRANLQNADLSGADLSKTEWRDVDLNTADLSHARLCDSQWDVNLRGANLQAAYLCNAALAGSRYNSATRWPNGFDPEAEQLVLR